MRQHPFFSTLEVRICDIPMCVDETLAIAALIQATVAKLYKLHSKNQGYRMYSRSLIMENKWRAARYGLDADIVIDEKETVRPVRQAITDLVEDLEPIARRLGCAAELADVERVLATGASYQRQRAVAAAHDGDLCAVVDSLLAELRNGLPAPGPAGSAGGLVA